jgi:hypothetical protein
MTNTQIANLIRKHVKWISVAVRGVGSETKKIYIDYCRNDKEIKKKAINRLLSEYLLDLDYILLEMSK